MASKTRVALMVVFSSEALPWMVVIPRSFSEGWCAARRMAKASYINAKALQWLTLYTMC